MLNKMMPYIVTRIEANFSLPNTCGVEVTGMVIYFATEELLTDLFLMGFEHFINIRV